MDLIFKNNVYKILELFIENPSKDYSIRGIGRELKLNHATVLNYMDGLLRLKLIKKRNDTLYPTFHSNIEDNKFKFYKKNFILFKISESGLVEYIKSKTLASSIILFGSCAKGTFTEKSDLDIFVAAKEQKIDLKKYEKNLKMKINLLFEQDIKDLSSELRNNVLNGVVMDGFIRVR